MQNATGKPSMLDEALQNAGQGWKVFPVHGINNGRCTCGKSSCGSPAKHPIAAMVPHGRRDASADQDKIRGWWAKHPHANIAVATGKESGLFAVDVDLPDGSGSIQILENKYGKLPETVEQITGTGGRHLLFKIPDDVEIRNSAGKLGPNLDIRGEGGFILLAPSKHVSGNSYTWRPGHGPLEIGIAEAPQWLTDLLKIAVDPRKEAFPQPSSASPIASTTPYGRAVINGEIRTLAETQEGQRNDALNRSAFKIGQLIRSGEVSLAEAEKDLIKTGEQLGLTPQEVRATVNSGLKKGMSHPRVIQNSGIAVEMTKKFEPPRPLAREIPPGGEYPIEALGQRLGDAVRAISDLVQVPHALAAGSVLATASLATQGYADIVLPISVGHSRPLSLYIMTIAESSDRKTTADVFALGAVKKTEEIMEKAYQREIITYLRDKYAYDKTKDVILKRNLKKTQTPAAGIIGEVTHAISELGNPPESPLTPYLTVQEPTIEALQKLLSSGRASIGLFTAEGGQMIGGYSMHQERRLNTFSVFSTLWDGEPLKRIRIIEGNYSLRGKRLAIHLMVQPGVASRILCDPEIADQGLLSRILIAAPGSLAGTRLFREAELSSLNSLNRFEETIREILSTPLPLVEGSRNELKPRRLPLSPAAKRIWISFHDEIETEIGRGGKFEQIKAFAGKLAEHAARIAGILTLIENRDATEVSNADMESGCTLARFYAAEALRLHYVGLTSPELSEAQKLLDWLHKWDEELISLPDIYQRGPNSIREKARAAQLVKILVDHGWLMPVPDGSEIQGQFRREVWKIIRLVD